MKIERVISCFDKNTEELVTEINIDDIDLELLKTIFKFKSEDPQMYDPYTITPEEVDKLKEVVSIKFNFDYFIYQIDCFQI